MLEKKYGITENDKDYIDTSKFDNFSVEELDKYIEEKTKNYQEYRKEKLKEIEQKD